MTLESDIQKKIINYLKNEGYLVVKTIVLNVAGYPDIFAFKNDKTLFVEVKNEKGKVSDLQQHRINSLKQQGFDVIISRSIEDFKETLLKLKVSQSLEWMPKAGKEVNTINFNYFENDELINIKYRGANKDFKMFKDGKLKFFKFRK